MAGGAIRFHYDVSGSEFSLAGTASADVKAQLKKMGVPSDAIRRAAIALYEGEINLVIHAGGGAIDVDMAPGVINMAITDEGPGIPDIDLAMSEGYSSASDEVRNLGFGAGMGLPNMKKYTDSFDIQSQVGKGTSITMSVRY